MNWIPQAGQARRASPAGLGQPARGLADVAGLAVDVLQKGSQFLPELLIIVGAAEPAGVAEVDELDAAELALAVHHRGLVGLLGGGGPAGALGAFLLRLIE